MHLDNGAIAAYFSMMGGAMMVIFGMIYKFGKLMNQFDTSMAKLSRWEESAKNLDAIPDIKQGIQALAENDKRQTSDISDLRERMAHVEGAIQTRPRLPSRHDIEE